MHDAALYLKMTLTFVRKYERSRWPRFFRRTPTLDPVLDASLGTDSCHHCEKKKERNVAFQRRNFVVDCSLSALSDTKRRLIYVDVLQSEIYQLSLQEQSARSVMKDLEHSEMLFQ